MPTANARKGSATERMVAAYLRKNGFPEADRRLREGRMDDQGDIDGVPFTVIQVKYVAANRYQQWVDDTLRQRDNAGAPLCLLVRRIPQKPVEQWEASMPTSGYPEAEAWTWTRMDLRLAVDRLSRMIRVEEFCRSVPYSSTTELSWPDGTRASVSVPSTEKGTPPSPTT